MKVLHFFKTYFPDTVGGIEQVIYQLSEGARKYDVQSDVLYLSNRGAAQNEIYASHVTHRSKLDFHVASTGFSLSVIKDFSRLAREADVIHYHFPWPYMDVVHFLAGVRKPTVVTYHSDIVKQKKLLKLYQPLMYKFLHSVDAIVASSPNYFESSSVLQDFRDKVTVIPFGLDGNAYVAPNQEKLTSWRIKLPGKFFLFIGALRYYKGLEYLLDAAAVDRYPVVIVGSGPQEAELKSKAAELKLSNVIFLGGVSDEDKAALLELCYAFVFPSHLRSEAFGISLLEAAMCGKPMISCEIGTGTSFINIDKVTGFVVPPRDPSALAKAMSSLWAAPALAVEMGAFASLRCKEEFSIEKMLESYVSLYRNIVK